MKVFIDSLLNFSKQFKGASPRNAKMWVDGLVDPMIVLIDEAKEYLKNPYLLDPSLKSLRKLKQELVLSLTSKYHASDLLKKGSKFERLMLQVYDVVQKAIEIINEYRKNAKIMELKNWIKLKAIVNQLKTTVRASKKTVESMTVAILHKQPVVMKELEKKDKYKSLFGEKNLLVKALFFLSLAVVCLILLRRILKKNTWDPKVILRETTIKIKTTLKNIREKNSLSRNDFGKTIKRLSLLALPGGLTFTALYYLGRWIKERRNQGRRP